MITPSLSRTYLHCPSRTNDTIVFPRGEVFTQNIVCQPAALAMVRKEILIHIVSGFVGKKLHVFPQDEEQHSLPVRGIITCSPATECRRHQRSEATQSFVSPGYIHVAKSAYVRSPHEFKKEPSPPDRVVGSLPFACPVLTARCAYVSLPLALSSDDK